MVALAGPQVSVRVSTSAVPARRFVQFPTDTERSSSVGFEAGSSAWVRLASPGDAPAQGAQLLGALLALLHRYTQQATIAMDVSVLDGSGDRRIALDCDVAGDAAVFSVIEEARVALAAASPSFRGVDEASNIAATFIHASSGDARSIDASAFVARRPNCDMHFVLSRTHDANFLAVAYNAKLLRPSTIDRLMESYVAVLGEAARDDTTAIDRLPLLGPARDSRAHGWSRTAEPRHPPSPVPSLFEAMAKRQPAALAASFKRPSPDVRRARRTQQPARPTTWSPAEWDREIAGRRLRSALVGRARGDAGDLEGARDLPPARSDPPGGPRGADARRGAAPARPDVLGAVSGSPARFPQLCFDTDAGNPGEAADDRAGIESSRKPHRPGLSLLHLRHDRQGQGGRGDPSNLAQYIQLGGQQKYGFCADDVFSSLARYTFSISLFELVSPLCCGGSLRILDRDEVLTPERLLRALEEVTVLHAGPSLLGSLFRYLRSTPAAPRTLPRMRHASSGGDMVAPLGDGGDEAGLSERGALRHLRMHRDKLHGDDLPHPARDEGEPDLRGEAFPGRRR